MADLSPEVTYSNSIGFIFIFNLIVGTGALTLPAIFAKSGWLLSLVVLILLAFISYVTATFIVESIACTNAVKNWQLNILNRNHEFNSNERTEAYGDNLNQPLLRTNQCVQSSSESELERMHLTTHTVPIYFYYRLNRKFELGEMASLFFNDFGRCLFFVCIAIYLYGDLSIYSTAVSTSLRDIVCDHTNITEQSITLIGLPRNKENETNMLCWREHTFTRLNVYRLFLIGFTLILGPFSAFSVQKTKYLQMMSVCFRWLAFIFMISIAIKRLLSDGSKGHPDSANFNTMPTIFGACVYSFMCHHSLPGLITPIRNKLSIQKIIFYDYIVICCFYIVLAMTGIFAFEHIMDLYTLNFIPINNSDHNVSTILLVAIDYFLAFFPVFTLSASYPIIAITLCNNLRCLFLDVSSIHNYNLFLRRILFPLITVCPPFIVTYFTQSIDSLVAFTGSYAGSGIQYLIPVALVYCARQTCQELLGNGVRNQFESPFRNNIWLILIALWAVLCIVIVTINFFI